MSDSSDRYERIPTWLRDLVFVTDFFSWLFALCSRLAEPLMLLCTLYIVAEAGVPALALPALHNLAIGIMICAPEIILPGSFVVAARAQEHARLLFAVCWTFVGLTLLTLISLQPVEKLYCRVSCRRKTSNSALIYGKFVAFLSVNCGISHHSKLSIFIFQQAVCSCGTLPAPPSPG